MARQPRVLACNAVWPRPVHPLQPLARNAAAAAGGPAAPGRFSCALWCTPNTQQQGHQWCPADFQIIAQGSVFMQPASCEGHMRTCSRSLPLIVVTPPAACCLFAGLLGRFC